MVQIAWEVLQRWLHPSQGSTFSDERWFIEILEKRPLGAAFETSKEIMGQDPEISERSDDKQLRKPNHFLKDANRWESDRFLGWRGDCRRIQLQDLQKQWKLPDWILEQSDPWYPDSDKKLLIFHESRLFRRKYQWCYFNQCRGIARSSSAFWSSPIIWRQWCR